MEHSKGYARVLTAQPLGISAELVTVEADLSRGLHAFSIVGMADKAVAESRDRISSAIKHAGFKPPKATNRRIVLSLSPANLRKDGSQYDLPLAIAYLVAAGNVPAPRERSLFCGELGLDGSVRPVRNVIAHASCAYKEGIRDIYVPAENAQEALLVTGVHVYPVLSLAEVISHLCSTTVISKAEKTPMEQVYSTRSQRIDFSDIRGQEGAKRALLIAVAGRHNVMLYGPPGTGKTMLARALPGIMPNLSEAEVLSVTSIHAAAGTLEPGSVITQAPFRAPHHTISTTAMIGGGPLLRPGEISLAHAGILFMDEFIEFDSRTLESLRQPLEDRTISIARTKGALTLPADCMLVAAINPANSLTGDDTVMRQQMQRQSKKLSRPIIDRIDMWVEVARVPYKTDEGTIHGSTSKELRAVVEKARTRIASNTEYVWLEESAELLATAANRLSLSARSIVRVRRVAETIAALDDSRDIRATHIMEALQYRPREPFI